MYQRNLKTICVITSIITTWTDTSLKGEKDIGVHVDTDLNFHEHIHKAVNKANRIMGITRKPFSCLNNSTFLPIFKGLVRPQLEYAAPVWSPHQKELIRKVESVQRMATKRLPGMNGLEYNERLRKLKLPTLAYRRTRGDMIQVFKLIMPIKKVHMIDHYQIYLISNPI